MPLPLGDSDDDAIDAVVFDLDGVLTDTASAHFAAWKEVFDKVLEGRAENGSRPFTRHDYRTHVDGMPRLDGVRRFLASRGIELPEGAEGDRGWTTVHGIGALKNEAFGRWLERIEVPVFEDAVALVDALRARGVRVGMFSASRNAPRVLESAGLTRLFGTRVDGNDARELGLAGKPDPAMPLECLARLGAQPGRAAIVEDAVAGVKAGRAGGFRLVAGVARGGAGRAALSEAGADIVLHDLRRLLTEDGGAVRTTARLPAAGDRLHELRARLSGTGGTEPDAATGAVTGGGAAVGGLAVFLDFDGTLAPIVEDYRDAALPDGMARALARVAERHRVAVVSGRGLDDLAARVAVPGVGHAGSHGFEVAVPGGGTRQPEEAGRFLPALDAAEERLRDAVGRFPGAEVERKPFAIAVHYRRAAPDDAPAIDRAVAEVAADHPDLSRSGGRKVFELRPRIEWDKGRAIRWILEETRMGEGEPLPVYIGDDLTDEDAFDAIAGIGIGIVVRSGHARPTSADYALDDVDAVERFLLWLAGDGAEGAT